ncbi:phospholipase-like protein [Tanacetum coccineum]
MSIYVNEVNVVNQNEPPSSEKVVGQLMRKRFVGKAIVEPYTDLSRAPYSRRTKVKLPECVDKVYALGDDTSYIFPWGNYDIYVYRSFWLNLLGLKEGGWLSDRHLDVWFDLMWSFRPIDVDWAIANSYFCGFVMWGDLPGWVCNGVRYPVMWADVEQVAFDLLRDALSAIFGYYLNSRSTLRFDQPAQVMVVKYIPPYLQEWGILDAKGIPLESYKINFVVGKDVPIQGDAYGDCGVWVCIFLYRLIHKMAVSAKDPQIVGLAYREHMFDYFWKYKIAS